MSRRWKNRVVSLASMTLMLGAIASFAGCEQGPAEKAGAQLDKGVQDVKDTVSPPGPVEKAGRAVDKAVKP